MECQALAHIPVVQLVLGLPVLPGTVHSAHLAPGDRHAVVSLRLQAPFPTHHSTFRVEHEHLVATKTVATTRPSSFWWVSTECIKTPASSLILQLSPVLVGRHFGILFQHIISYLSHEPVEALAVLLLLQFELVRQISSIDEPRQGGLILQ